MAVSADLRTFLLADGDISSTVATRVYPIQLPQKPTLPAIRYNTITDVRYPTTPNTKGLRRPRIQIDCYATTYAAAVQLAEYVEARLDSYRGAAGATSIQGAFLVNGDEFFEDDKKAYVISRDYFVWFPGLS